MGEALEIKTYKIKNVEIFSAGVWNKDKYSIEDLHKIVTAFNNLKDGFRPFIKLGHDDKQKLAKSSGLPSVGWVENIYVNGDKLYADLDYIPEKVFKLIKSKAYRKVSCEIYWDLDVDGTKYARVLGGIALLGAENPGVMNLDDILSNYTLRNNNMSRVFEAFDKSDSFKGYAINLETKVEDEMSDEIKKELDDQKKAYSNLSSEKENLKKEYDLEISKKDDELKKYKLEAEAALKEANAAKLSKFITELESKKLVTPAMKELVQELMSNKKEYTVKEKTYSKEELLSEILVLSQEAGKINFTEGTRSDFGKKDSKEKELEKKIEKYAQDNKCDYAKAYKAVMKDEMPVKEEEE